METPDSLKTSYYNYAQFTTEKGVSGAKNADHFIIEDLLNLPNDEGMGSADGRFESELTGTSTDSSVTTAVDISCNTSFSDLQAAAVGGSDGGGPFDSELFVPYDDMAELEWLSNIVDESFSSDDLQKLNLIQGKTARNNEPAEAHTYQSQPERNRPTPIAPTEMSVPAKARSKRSRTAPGNWTSRLLAVSPTPPTAPTPAMSSSSEIDVSSGEKSTAHKKKEVPGNSFRDGGCEGRRCVHCDTDKTPQWRTGPMGPKTLCNACGVRYKSGRLVPEYRPAASPTFVMTKHSNSHRKVLELRRQKEMQRPDQQFLHQQDMIFDVSTGDDYLIHQHTGLDFRQLI